MTAHPFLLKHYGTSQLLTEKMAGELPLVARLSSILVSAGLGHSAVKSQANQREEAALLNLLAEEAEKGRLRPALTALQHSHVKPLIGRGGIDPSLVPVGMDEGMTRLASIAEASGRALAKLGGMGYTDLAAGAGKLMGGAAKRILPGWKGQAALGAGAIGAAYLGTKAVRGGLRALGNEGHAKNYGAGNYQVPTGVNEYGQPQAGT